MMEVAALVGMRMLDTFDDVIAHRLSIADEYVRRLSVIPGLTVQQVPAGNLSTRLYMAIVVNREVFGLTADEIVEALRAENIVGRRFLDPPVHRMSYYRQRFGEVSLPVTEFIAANAVALPLYSDMTMDEVARITAAVRQLQGAAPEVRARLSSAPATA